MATTTNIGLRLLDVGQKEKEATINSNMQLLDSGLPRYLGEFATPPSATGLPAGTTYLNTTTSITQVLKSDGTWLNMGATGGGTGTVTNVIAGTGLSGGSITSTGTIAIANTGVTAGTYTVPSITVNARGQITAASNGSAAAAAGLTTQVQYNNAGTMAGSTKFTWNESTTTLTLGTSSIDAVISSGKSISIAPVSTSSTNAGITTISAGSTSAVLGIGGSLNLTAGSAVSGTGGSVNITAGGLGGTAAGNIKINTASGNFEVWNGINRKFTILDTGAWTFGNSLTNYGTVGQTLKSNGPGQYPTWSNPVMAGVSSFNGRIGDIALTLGDVTSVIGYTPLQTAVTSVTAGTGLTGGVITGTGTLGLATTTVAAGSYTTPNITVDAYGRITSAYQGTVAATPGGSIYQLQYNTGTTIGGAPALTYNTGTGVFNTGVIVSSSSITAAGDITLGNNLKSNYALSIASGNNYSSHGDIDGQGSAAYHVGIKGGDTVNTGSSYVGQGGNAFLQGGVGSTIGGHVIIAGGYNSSTSYVYNGGHVFIRGGQHGTAGWGQNSTGQGGFPGGYGATYGGTPYGTGGGVFIAPGNGPSNNDTVVSFCGGGDDAVGAWPEPSGLHRMFTISKINEWFLNGSGTFNTSNGSCGTSGQVIVSGGPGQPVSWANVTSLSGGTVTSVSAGTGLTGGPITSTGTLSLANTSVSAGSYTSANITVDAQGRITSASNGTPGTVTSVGLTSTDMLVTNGPITTSGTMVINLNATGVTPGSYTAANITVDSKGRITAVSNGAGAGSTSPAYEEYTATAGQTVFDTTLRTNANAGGYTSLMVFVNGVKQREGATKGYQISGIHQITFTSALALNDDVEIISFA